jgi:hypothetical protein
MGLEFFVLMIHGIVHAAFVYLYCTTIPYVCWRRLLFGAGIFGVFLVCWCVPAYLRGKVGKVRADCLVPSLDPGILRALTCRWVHVYVCDGPGRD